MAIPPLVLRVVADTRGVVRGVAHTRAQVGGLRGAVARNSALIKTAFLGIGIAAAVGIGKAVGMAIEAQEAQLKLANSIKNSAVVSDDAKGRFLAQAEALRQLTAVDDDAIIGVQALLVQFGLTEKQVSALTPRVVDLSAKMGIDLDTAAKAVGKSVNGTTGGLSRMGVVVDKNKAATDAYGATLDALGVAQGFAAEKAKTQPWEQLKSEFGELAEDLGTLLIPALRATTRWLTNVVRWIREEFVPWVKEATTWVRDKFGPAFQTAKAIIVPVVNAIVSVIKGLARWVENTVAAVEHLLELLGAALTKAGELSQPVPPVFGGPGFIPRGAPRQHGGPVVAGVAHLVGERGPELFVPRVSGTVVANGAMGTPNVTVYIGEEKVEGVVVRALNKAGRR